ncbi:hypothetical protein [Rhodanobacter aciditrophus]|uniref:hypothetical protein n=1 Tax=Rhodanobacter aciditrophus TaxID=1623218 RepID=UPI003CF24AD0
MWHLIESSLIHGLIYRALSACMLGLGLHGVLAFVVVGILGMAVAHVITRRLFGWRSRRRW